MIPQSFILQLKTNCDIVDIVSSYVPLKNEGRNKKCLCPFHLEKTPSCVIYEQTQSFYCFGCGAGGDVISFIERIENLDYTQAVKLLAQRAGMSLPESEESDLQSKQRMRVLEMNRLAARFFYQTLISSAGRPGMNYFRERRLNRDTIVRYGLGYAKNSWDSLRDHLKQKGFSYEEMVQADLVSKSSKGSFYDKFRNRIMFPIIDLRGNIIAFGGRVLDDGKPKYLNSSDTVVFKKSHHLFSLNFAKNSGERTLVLCEGYMDVIAMNQGGISNSVATLGTALTPEQARLISRYADNVVVAYDADKAGRKATDRAARLFFELGIEVRVLEILGAKDPDEYIKKNGAGRFSVLIKQAKNITTSNFERLKQKYNIKDPEQQSKYVREYCEAVAEMPDPLKRDIYIGKLAQQNNLPREGITKQVEKIILAKQKQKKKRQWNEIVRAPLKNQDKINPDSIKYPKAAKAEEGILSFLFQNPEFWEYSMQELSPDDFVTKWNAKVYRVLLERLSKHDSIDLSSFHTVFEPEEISRISRLINQGKELSNAKQALNDYIIVIRQQYSRTEEDAALMTPQQLEQRRKRQAQKKR